MGASPEETCSRGRAGLGARVTRWTPQPPGSPAGTAAVLFVEAASETAVAIFLLDTTRGAVAGRWASPHCWHVVKKHAHRLVCAPPSFIVSAGTPRSAESPRGFSLVLAGGGVCGPCTGATPAPHFPSRPAAARERLCLKVGLEFRGSHPTPSWARAHSSLGLGCFHNGRTVTLAPKSPSGIGNFGKLSL